MYKIKIKDDKVGAVVELLTYGLRVAGSIPAGKKYLNGLQVIVPGLAVCVCDFCMLVSLKKIRIGMLLYTNITLKVVVIHMTIFNPIFFQAASSKCL